jgi:uncharacterized tellurite resistance protein B-like protein
MACDGDIDKEEEVPLLKSMCENLPFLKGVDFQTEVNLLIDKLNKQGIEFISDYLNVLKNSTLTEEETVILIDSAIQMIKADNIIKYSEIKFFKAIRHSIKISDDKILEKHPDFETYREEDIVTESFLDVITKQYLDIAELPQFEAITIDASLLENNKQ